MAKRRTASTAIVPYAPRGSAPVIRIATPRPIVRREGKRKGKRHHRGGGTRVTFNQMFAAATGGAAVGYLETTSFYEKIPSLPVIGKKGTVALAGYFWNHSGGGGLARDICLAASVLSGYQFGKEQKISGDDE